MDHWEFIKLAIYKFITLDYMPKFQSDLDFYLDLQEDKSLIRRKLEPIKFGIYYWFIKLESIGLIIKTTINPVNLFTQKINGVDYILIYIGIGPRNIKTKKQFFNSRILECHLGNQITKSTFRMALASCFEYNSYKRQVGKDLKYFLSYDDELLLTSFIKSNFILGIKKHPSPWDVEDMEINLYTPPLNIQHNKKGWNLENIKLLRKSIRDRAILI